MNSITPPITLPKHLTSSHTHDQEEESQQESTSQPDQEPENQGDIETPGISENGDHAEVIMYTCHEVANAFTVEAVEDRKSVV